MVRILDKLWKNAKQQIFSSQNEITEKMKKQTSSKILSSYLLCFQPVFLTKFSPVFVFFRQFIKSFIQIFTAKKNKKHYIKQIHFNRKFRQIIHNHTITLEYYNLMTYQNSMRLNKEIVFANIKAQGEYLDFL